MQDKTAFPPGESPDSVQGSSSLGTGVSPDAVTATPQSGTPQSDQQQSDVEADDARNEPAEQAGGDNQTISGKQDA